MDLNMTLATTNAVLTTLSGVLLLVGYYFIRTGRRRRPHMWAMIGATACQGLFLISYLTRIYIGGTTAFQGTGIVRTVYFLVLSSHVLLAIAALPFILLTLWRAYRGQFGLHRRVARPTFWIWLYVSSTGPVVYWMLHRMYG
jgi:uncharacterized membrane protein YozB (DUF420 family)